MNRRLAKTILATLSESEVQPEEFAHFNVGSWRRSYDWLDTSGVALYLLERIKSKGLTGSIPEEVLMRLEENQRDNCARTEQLFREFVEINTAFRQAGIRFVNLKGITLVPDYCHNPQLRFQVDHDFLVESSDAKLCKEILESRDYRLTGTHRATWEFKAGANILSELRDMYKPKPQRSLEIHFATGDPGSERIDERISHAQLQTWGGFTFSALNESDKFIAQAEHLNKHLRGEWTRLSWVLEYRAFIALHRADDDLWNEVNKRARDCDEIAIAIGVCTKIALNLFGACSIGGLDPWTAEKLPDGVNRWINQYSEESVIAEFPGTKLYLLLEEGGAPQKITKKTLKKLLPTRLPPWMMRCEPTMSLRVQCSGLWQQVRFVIRRVRFHVVAGVRYVLETVRLRLFA